MYINRNEREYKRGDVIFVRLNGEGSVQSNNRPVIVVSNNKCNAFSPVIQIVPLTSRVKKFLPTHVKINSKCLSKESISLAEQITTIDKGQIISFIGTLEESVMKEIDKTIKVSFGLINKNTYEEEKNKLLKSIQSLDYLLTFSLSKGANINNIKMELRELRLKVNKYNSCYKEEYILKCEKYINNKSNKNKLEMVV